MFRGGGAERMDASVVRSTGWTFRGPGLDSQHPHGSSQLSVTPVSGDLMPSSVLLGDQALHMVHRHTCKQKAHIHKLDVAGFMGSHCRLDKGVI